MRLGDGVGRAELGQTPLEQTPLGVVVDQRPGTSIGLARPLRSAEAAQQLAPCRVQVALVLEDEPIDDIEPGLGALRLGDGDGPAQLDDR